jgi:hypothetical protein
MQRDIVLLRLIILIVVGVATGCQPVQPVAPVQTGTPVVERLETTGEALPCPVFDFTTQQRVTGNSDPLALLLATGKVCPANVFELRTLLLEEGAQLTTTIVANRGFHNPAQGGFVFSLFEMVEGTLESIALEIGDGEFFFGHFVGTQGSTLVAHQSEGLLIELIAWDETKGAYNFYELHGNGPQQVWVYNGDSYDILADLTLLHQQPNPERPQLGRNLRCSGCHMAGGPIMKELASPHTDWWTVERGLKFGARKPEAHLATIVGKTFDNLADANELASGVLRGLEKLQTSPAFQAHLDSLNLRTRLRALFCPVELNLESDRRPLDAEEATVQIPAAFFVDPRLAQGVVSIDKSHYRAALDTWNAAFPETDRQDGDRAWETPVKATSDILAVQTLVDQGVIDEEFVFDVLAVDMTNPAISRERCSLLRLVPNDARDDWQAVFIHALTAAQEENPAAEALLGFLTDPTKNMAFHQAQAQQLLTTCQERLQDKDSVADLFGLLAQKRAEVSVSEISQSPGGEILEPGFRVIFPAVMPTPRPWSSTLTTTCQVAAIDGQ